MHTRIRNVFVVLIGILALAACGTQTTPGDAHELTVNVDGTGSGTVTSDTGGISTGDSQSVNIPAATEVTLTASADAGSSFDGFSVPDDADYSCEDADTTDNVCVVTMDQAKTITATFTAEGGTGEMQTVTAAVNTGGSADGSVTSEPAGIDCQADGSGCSSDFEVGTAVTLTAEASAGGFAGWTGGDCDGVTSTTCTIDVNTGEETVTAHFNDLTEVTAQVSSSANDAEEFLQASNVDADQYPAGWVWGDSNDLELAYDPVHAVPQMAGLRFQGVNLPAGAIVNEATLTFTAMDDGGTGSTGDVTLSIAAQQDANPGEFVGDADGESSNGISNRALTEASADWTITEQWTADQEYTSSSVAHVLQEVVALEDWASGQAVVFVVDGDEASTEYRRAYSSDGDPASAPVLTVSYAPMP